MTHHQHPYGSIPIGRRRPLYLAAAFLALFTLTAAPAMASVDNRPFQEIFGPAAQPRLVAPNSLAFNRNSDDLLVFDQEGSETQELKIEASSGLDGTYKLSFGGQSTGWQGEATLVPGSTAATGAVTLSGRLINGEQISGSGIQPGTIATAVNEAAGTFNLSKPASAGGTFALTADLPYGAISGSIQEALESLTTIGVGDVQVTGEGSASPVRRQIVFRGTFAAQDVPSVVCDGSGLTGTSSSCSVAELFSGHRRGVMRFHADGTTATFADLGSNLIDGRLGPGGRPCAEEAASCDVTPQGSLAASPKIAVDDSGGTTDGNIYVVQQTPNLVDIFAPNGHYLGQISTYKEGATEKNLGGITSVAVDMAGNVYIADNTKGLIHKYVSQGPPHNPLTAEDSVANFSFNAVSGLVAGGGPTAGFIFANNSGGQLAKLDASTGALAYYVIESEFLDSSVGVISQNATNGHLFVSTRGGENVIDEYDASSSSSATLLTQAVLPGRTDLRPSGIAPNPTTGQLYVDRQSGHSIETYGPTAKPFTLTKPASNLAATSATLNGTVNPNGTLLESCSFEWGLTGEPYEHTEPCAESTAEIGEGEEPIPVHLDLSGLEGGTTYHYRLTAANSLGAKQSEDASFLTARPPAIEEQWVHGVSTKEAELQARINPEGFASTYQIEYGPTSSFGKSTEVRSLGATDVAPHLVSAILEGLNPGTTYHWRLIVDNTDPDSLGTGTEIGTEGTFHTFALPVLDTGCLNQAFRTSFAAGLPDCRAYEMVSPVEKNNGDVFPLNEATSNTPSGLNRSATSGDRFTYTANRSFAQNEAAPWNSQYMAERTEGGWTNRGISPPRGVPLATIFQQTYPEYRTFSDNLCSGWLVFPASGALVPGAAEGFLSLYRQNNCGEENTYEALTPDQPPHGRANPETEPQGTSADGSTVVFTLHDNLTPDAPDNSSPAGFSQLYLRNATGLRFVCILPDGIPSPAPCTAGAQGAGGGYSFAATLKNALSEDGSSVYWTSYPASSSEYGPGAIYLRRNAGKAQSAINGSGECTQSAKACTVAVSQTVSQAAAQFWAAAKDGSAAVFSVRETGSPFDGNLYEFDAQTGESTLIGEGTQGVLGTSEDVSRVYFSSDKALTGEANSEGDLPKEGAANIYLYERGGGIRFVGTLAAGQIDAQGFSPEPIRHTSRVTPNGLHAAFVSIAHLTGYDNTDAATGEPDSEVYLYDAGANGGKGRLYCASCNPTGARPHGHDLYPQNWAPNHAFGAATLPFWQTALYAARVLSDDGSRLYFESSDALAVPDSNGLKDVYQWEAPGSGDCTTQSSSYSPSNGGCIDLISTGKSSQESSFVDADPSGSNVFFATLSSLLPQDIGLVDIYDARAGGGFPPPAGLPAACEGEACQGPLSPPDDPTPASSTFEGAGNVREEATAGRKRCLKGKRRAGKARCAGKSGAHRKHHSHRNRAANRQGRTGR